MEEVGSFNKHSCVIRTIRRSHTYSSKTLHSAAWFQLVKKGDAFLH